MKGVLWEWLIQTELSTRQQPTTQVHTRARCRVPQWPSKVDYVIILTLQITEMTWQVLKFKAKSKFKSTL